MNAHQRRVHVRQRDRIFPVGTPVFCTTILGKYGHRGAIAAGRRDLHTVPMQRDVDGRVYFVGLASLRVVPTGERFHAR